MTDETGAGEYDRMLLLEDLESLREEMEEVGVTSLEEVRRWLDAPRADHAQGRMAQAELTALRSIRELMEEYSITTLRQLEEQIAELHADLDVLGEG